MEHNKYFEILVCLQLLFPLMLFAQQPWQQDLDAYYQLEDFDSPISQSEYETLEFLFQHPININTATQETLQQIPFLTEKQIEELQEYIYRYGKIKSLNELMMIESLGYETRNLLVNFVCVEDSSSTKFPGTNKILKYGKHDIAITGRVPFYNRRGDSGAYLGYKYKHSVRYDFHYGNYVRFGIVGGNDAGEPWFGKNKWGYDHYSYYAMLRNIGSLKTLALGCYKVSFGMGLVVNSTISFGKLSALTSLGRTSNNIRVHASQSEYNYFNGLASTVEIAKGLQVSAFISNRNLDATLNKDSMSISSFVTSGYHRTFTEYSKKGNTNEKTIGGNIDFHHRNIVLGATIISSHLDKPLRPDTGTIYRRYYPNGQNFMNLGAYYGFDLGKWSFRGELATNQNSALALVNKMSFMPNGNLKIMALQRFYSYKYSSLYANSFSENGNPQNESGVYLGAEWRISSKWSVMAYTDWFYFPWAKYQVSQSSSGTDNLVQASFSSDNISFSARYRIKVKEKDSDEKQSLKKNIQQRMRLACKINTHTAFSFKTQLDGTITDSGKQEYGVMFTQSVNYDNRKGLKFGISGNYFNSTSYDSRLYAYEKNLRYVYSFPSYYGKGMRLSLCAELKVCDRLQIGLKAGHTKYFDRDEIGSSYQLISQSSYTDLDLQAILKL